MRISWRSDVACLRYLPVVGVTPVIHRATSGVGYEGPLLLRLRPSPFNNINVINMAFSAASEELGSDVVLLSDWDSEKQEVSAIEGEFSLV
jgi:hypothetical protein